VNDNKGHVQDDDIRVQKATIAASLFSQLSKENQSKIIDLLKTILSEK
jgi:hypothetical protein